MRFVAFLSFLLFPLITVARAQVSAEGQACLDCHSTTTLVGRELTHNKSSPCSQCIRLSIAECSLQDLLQVGLLMAASEKEGGRNQPSLPAVHSLQSGLASKNREKWAEFAHLVESKGRNSLQSRLSGGESGILLPPFRVSSCGAYTSMIIPCV